MFAELAAGFDFGLNPAAFSCIAAGSQTSPYAQADLRGWTCFDIATPGTLGLAFGRGAATFGRNCSNMAVGDGLITIHDIVLNLMIRYRLPPYDVPLTTITIEAPLTRHDDRCTEYEEGAILATQATCAEVMHDSARRQLSEFVASIGTTLSIVSELPSGMWVSFVPDRDVMLVELRIDAGPYDIIPAHGIQDFSYDSLSEPQLLQLQNTYSDRIFVMYHSEGTVASYDKTISANNTLTYYSTVAWVTVVLPSISGCPGTPFASSATEEQCQR